MYVCMYIIYICIYIYVYIYMYIYTCIIRYVEGVGGFGERLGVLGFRHFRGCGVYGLDVSGIVWIFVI